MFIALYVRVVTMAGTLAGRPRQRGQAVTEYVLLLLGVAAVALLVTAWAAQTGKIGELLDKVFTSITDKVQ